MKDFLVQDLPKSREELIKYLQENRKGLFIRLFLILIPFMAPFFFWMLFSRYYLNPFNTEIKSGEEL